MVGRLALRPSQYRGSGERSKPPPLSTRLNSPARESTECIDRISAGGDRRILRGAYGMKGFGILAPASLVAGPSSTVSFNQLGEASLKGFHSLKHGLDRGGQVSESGRVSHRPSHGLAHLRKDMGVGEIRFDFHWSV